MMTGTTNAVEGLMSLRLCRIAHRMSVNCAAHVVAARDFSVSGVPFAQHEPCSLDALRVVAALGDLQRVTNMIDALAPARRA